MKIGGPYRKRTCIPLALRVAGGLGVLVPVVLAFVYVYRFGINVPFSDQWAEVPLFNKLSYGRLGLSDLFAQHNEHRIFFPRIVMLLLGTATAYNVVAEMYFIQLCAVATLIIFWLAFRDPSSGGGRYRLLQFVPVAFLLFSLRQHSSMLQGIQIVVAMTQTSAVLAFFCLYLSRQDRPRKPAFPAALASGTIASFSFLQGLFVWPVGLLQILLTPVRRQTKWLLAGVWTLVGAAEWALYFTGFSTNSERSLGYVLSAPVAAVTYLLTVAGGSLFWEPVTAVVAGVILLSLAAAVVFWVYRSRDWGDYPFWIAILSFALAFMLAVMLGRSEDGVERAITSRYVNFSILLPISVYVILLKVSLERRSRLATGLFVGLTAMVLVSLPGTYEKGLTAGVTTRDSREEQAFILSTYRSQPDMVVATLLSQFERTRREGKAALEWTASSMTKRAETLDRLDYSVFAGTESRPRLPDVADLSKKESSTKAVIGSIDGVRTREGKKPVPVSRAEVVVSVSGWAVDASAEEPAGFVYLEMDDTLYPAYYGLESNGLAGQLGVPAYDEARFEAKIPVLNAEPGVHELSLIVVTNDGSSYYEVPEAASVKVRGG